MGRLTTHVLDTARGQPAAGVRIELYGVNPDQSTCLLTTGVTNADGRVPAPLLEGEAFVSGSYQLTFRIGAYFSTQGVALADPPFLDVIPVWFQIADESAHYHVPLLVSPWAYSTYRGS